MALFLFICFVNLSLLIIACSEPALTTVLSFPIPTGSRNPRIAFATFGMGIGVGDAFRVSSIEFEKEKASRVNGHSEEN